MEIGALIRDARKRATLSQAALAERAHTSQPAVARYESGSATPSLTTLERLLAACGDELVLSADRSVPRSRDRRETPRSRALRRARVPLLAAAARHGVRRVRVFGSVGRRDDTERSDIDLLVDLEPRRTLVDLIGFQQEAEQILGTRVDAVAPRFLKRRVRERAVHDARPL